VIEATAAMQQREAQRPEGAGQSGARSSAVAGDQAAFGALVDVHYASVLRFLTRQTGDPDLAADLTQACFLDAYRSRHQLADEDAFAAWLFSIARNQLRMEWRRRKLRRFVSLDWFSERAGEVIPALSRDDETAVLDDRDRIQRVLDELSPTLREALLLHNLSGFRGGEVAQILGISADAARKRIVRAETEFRQRYGAAAPTTLKANVDDDV
jgi:RNA polymerase sigma-70 factor (ECF subfamily)